MKKYKKEDIERAFTLLKAVKHLLELQEDSVFILDLLSENVYYDEADCDGSCLLDDIRGLLENE